MIIVAGQMELDPAVLQEFTNEVLRIRPLVLDEDGCGFYSLLVEDAGRGEVTVSELWRDDAALARHLAQPWITAFLARFGPHLKSSTVRVYDVSGDRPLPGA